MNNSIFNQSLGGNNSIEPLDFSWKAIFNDETIIEQYDKNGTEHRFQEVKDRFSDLIIFQLINYKKEIIFTVDLINGNISKGIREEIPPDLITVKNNIRLIFFRRHKINFDMNITNKTELITNFIGYQYNDANNINHKVIMCIDKNGNFVIGDN